jgi:hypothetical protein
MIESFACRAPEESHLAAIERVAALFATRLAEPAALLGNAGLAAGLAFDHVGVMVPWGSGAEVVDELQGLGYQITERFESTVVAALLRTQCGQADLRVVVTTAERRDDSRCRLEVFCPENARADRHPCLLRLAPVIGHVAFRPVGDADVDELGEAVQARGFKPLMEGTNGNQRGFGGGGGGGGVSLRYYVNPDSALGQVKLELVSALPRPGLQPPVVAGRARAGLAQRLLTVLLPGRSAD